jgi:nucleoid DNA-binding protein
VNFEELVVKTSHIANRHPSSLTRSALDPVTQATIHRVLLAAIQAIRLELQAGGYIRVNMLGTLSTFVRDAYERPINLPGFAGKVQTIPARRLVRFKASASLLTYINQPPDEEERLDTWQPPGREIEIVLSIIK